MAEKTSGIAVNIENNNGDHNDNRNDVPANTPHKALGVRQMTFLAIGGAIGTGIFLYTGATIAESGPGNTLLGFTVVGVFVYSVVMMLGEMAAFIPTSGAFASYASRWVGESFGFALGIGYMLQWLFAIPAEISAASLVLGYWAPQLQAWHWALIIIVPMFLIQLTNVRIWAETEYWLSLIKIVFIILFILVGIIYFSSGIQSHPGPGLSNWHNNQAFLNGFSGFLASFTSAFYSYGGAELVALAAGEAKKPYKTIPAAVKATFFRIVIFFILVVFVIGSCMNYADPSLSLDGGDATASPMTTIFERAGFGKAVHVVNFVLLVAILSATNSCFYATTRMTLALAQDRQLPQVFKKVNRRGVPIPALMVTLAGSCLVFLTTIWGAGVTFTWFSNLTAMNALVVWTSVGLISIHFRRGLTKQGFPLSDLPYRQPLYPLLPVLCIILGVGMFAAEGYVAVRGNGPFDWRNVVATYIGLALFAGCYTGWELWKRPGLVDLATADFRTGAVWEKGEGEQVLRDESEKDALRWDRGNVVWKALRWVW